MQWRTCRTCGTNNGLQGHVQRQRAGHTRHTGHTDARISLLFQNPTTSHFLCLKKATEGDDNNALSRRLVVWPAWPWVQLVAYGRTCGLGGPGIALWTTRLLQSRGLLNVTGTSMSLLNREQTCRWLPVPAGLTNSPEVSGEPTPLCVAGPCP